MDFEDAVDSILDMEGDRARAIEALAEWADEMEWESEAAVTLLAAGLDQQTVDEILAFFDDGRAGKRASWQHT
jgi:hypothetical protein